MHPSLDAAHLAGAPLDRYYHACAFFHSRDEEYRVINPFVKEGLDWGERAVHITDPRRRDDHMRRLEIAAIEGSEHLRVMTWDEAYLRGGRFEPDAMLALVEEVLREGREQGYPRTRIVGHMEWAQEDRPGVDRVMEYEARVNDVLAEHKGPAVCVYDLNRLGVLTFVDILRTHPMVVIDGALRENPFFVPPAEFLRELEARGTPRAAD